MKHILKIAIIAIGLAHAHADEIPIGAVLRALHPQPNTGQPAWVVSDLGDGQGPRIVVWDASKLGPQPTVDQIAAVRQQIASLTALRAGLRNEYAALSVGEQALYSPTFAALTTLFNRTDLTSAQKIAAAREVITLAPVPTDPLAAARLRMLAVLSQ